MHVICVYVFVQECVTGVEKDGTVEERVCCMVLQHATA